MNVKLKYRVVFMFICSTLFWLWLLINPDKVFPPLIFAGIIFGLFMRTAQYFSLMKYKINHLLGGVLTVIILSGLLIAFLTTRNQLFLFIPFGYFAAALFSEHVVYFVTKKNLYDYFMEKQ